MLNLKITDRCLTVIFYLFFALGVFSMGLAVYEKCVGEAANIEFESAYTFIFFALFAKYNYAIQCWLNNVNKINNEERRRQLDSGQIDRKL